MHYVRTMFWEWSTRRDPECYRALMVRYWKFILVLIVVSFITAVAFGARTFFVAAVVPAGTSAPTGASAIATDKIQKSLDAFSNRKLQYTLRTKAPPRVADPS